MKTRLLKLTVYLYDILLSQTTDIQCMFELSFTFSYIWFFYSYIY